MILKSESNFECFYMKIGHLSVLAYLPEELMAGDGLDVIVYGLSAHILNKRTVEKYLGL